MSGQQALRGLWQLAQLPPGALACADLSGSDPVFPSSFAVGTAAQASIAAAALAACEFGHVRGVERQRVAVPMDHAATECVGWFSLDGRAPDLWDAFSGLYRARDGWVRLHANFTHHRHGALQLLGLDPATATRSDAEQAMLQWDALTFETAAADRGLVASALRSFGHWDATAQGLAIASLPLLTITRIGEADPLPLPAIDATQRPLHGVRVLDLTRILAGPVGGRALAAYGADVMLLNAPHLPNIEAIADTSRGKRSALADLRTDDGRASVRTLLQDSHVFLQGYRPGALAALGFGPEDVAALRPGIVAVSLSAYGTQGPWRGRRGFDSLVQAATGFNLAEAEAAGTPGQPRALPMQILDQATGYLIAFGTAAALRRQQLEGGSWHVEVSLAQTGHWLRGLGRIEQGFSVHPPAREPWLEASASGFGRLQAVGHSAKLSRTPAAWTLSSMPPGSSPTRW